MDSDEKAHMRAYISRYLDYAGTRLSDYQAQVLVALIDNYDDYRGKSYVKRSSHAGQSSGGRYVRTETTVDTFTETVGIHREYSYRDDDGQEGGHTEDIRTARGMFDWLWDNRQRVGIPGH